MKIIFFEKIQSRTTSAKVFPSWNVVWIEHHLSCICFAIIVSFFFCTKGVRSTATTPPDLHKKTTAQTTTTKTRPQNHNTTTTPPHHQPKQNTGTGQQKIFTPIQKTPQKHHQESNSTTPQKHHAIHFTTIFLHSPVWSISPALSTAVLFSPLKKKSILPPVFPVVRLSATKNITCTSLGHRCRV